MLSIITAIYNLYPMNRLFLESLKRYTHYPFELIIIDNGSTDGSAAYFEEHGAKVIKNDGNYSYPVCQNQGIREAKYDILVFLNNDIVVSPNWDLHALATMNHYGFEIGSCCATDRRENDMATRRSQRQWKYIRNPLMFFFGTRYTNLKLMQALFYGNWEAWNIRRQKRFGNAVSEGIAGSNVIMKRSALDKIGLWDERIQAADADILIRTKLRSIEKKDIKPLHLLHGVYLHHYIRLTLKNKYPPFKNESSMIAVNKKWDARQINPIIASCGIKLKTPSGNAR
jgi:GT2 family glycosyltransferase